MERRIARLENHIIICGAGRVGSEVIHHLKQDQTPFVVVESDQRTIQELKDQNLLFIEGDATTDEVLIAAGIRKARGIIASLPSDADNVFITLTAKELNPGVIVVARANRRDSESKLLRAGADRVVAPEALGGRRMAISILRPATVQFIDTIMYREGNDIEIEEITVADDSSLCHQTMRQAAINEQTGATVISIMRQGEITERARRRRGHQAARYLDQHRAAGAVGQAGKTGRGEQFGIFNICLTVTMGRGRGEGQCKGRLCAWATALRMAFLTDLTFHGSPMHPGSAG